MHTNCKNSQIAKIVTIIKAAPTCFGSHKTIIREPHPVDISTRTLVPDM